MKCEICSNEVTAKVDLNDNYKGFYCNSCDFIMTELKDVDTHENVNDDYYSDIKKRIKFYLLREKELNYRFEKIYKTFNCNQQLNICEIGSNLGYFSTFLKNKGHNIYSVEINDNLRDMQKCFFGIASNKGIENLEDNSIDLLVFMDVIEHIPEPLKFLEFLKPKLKENAKIYLQFPNHRSFIAKLTRSNWGWWSAPDHIYHFSPKSAELFLETAGFDIVRNDIFSPVLDDLSHIPIINKLIKPLWLVNFLFPINRLIYTNKGSLIGIQGILK